MIKHTEVVRLNDLWRVIDDESRQWILQRRYSNKWKSRSYCTSRLGLIRTIEEKVGPINAETLKTLNDLPDYFPTREKLEKRKLIRNQQKANIS